MKSKELINKLKSLKAGGVVEIKAEFEAEATRMNELIRLKDICSSAGLPIILKIGGVEAITDIYQALDIGVDYIIAPMAETPYAVSKFLDVIKTLQKRGITGDTKFAINIETISCYKNLDNILALDDIQLLSAFTVGRVDFAGSLGKDRSFVDSEEMFNYVSETFSKAKAKGLNTALGGAISANSLDFVKRLSAKGLVDKYETRKVVFSPSCTELGEAFIKSAVEFELMWLEYKRAYHLSSADEDLTRIEMIKSRLD